MFLWFIDIDTDLDMDKDMDTPTDTPMGTGSDRDIKNRTQMHNRTQT
jgi:hypothetical protein